MVGISEVNSAKPMELVGNNLLNFETFDAKIANSLKKSLVTNDFRKIVFIGEQQAQNANRFLRRRQVVFMIYDNFWITDTSDCIVDFSDHVRVSLRGENVTGF